MAMSLQASAARGRHAVLVTVASHIMALVFIGSLGPPHPAESSVGIAENDQGCPTGIPNHLSPL